MERTQEAAVDIFLPIMEGATILAAEYCKKSGRNTVTAKDMELGLKYMTRYATGKQMGSMFPEIYNKDSDSDSEDEIITEDEEEEWTRYTGDDDQIQAINACYDTWDQWEPETPAERALWNAIQNMNT